MYKRTGWRLFIFLLALLNGCGVPSRGQALSFETIDQSSVLTPTGRDAPAVIVFTNTQDVDTFAQNVSLVHPDLLDQLRQLNYQRSFALLALQGTRTGGARIIVQQVIRQGDRVLIQAQFFTPLPGQPRPAIQTDPYHLVAVSKEGSWGRPIQFQLLADGKQVAGTTHVIP